MGGLTVYARVYRYREYSVDYSYTLRTYHLTYYCHVPACLTTDRRSSLVADDVGIVKDDQNRQVYSEHGILNTIIHIVWPAPPVPLL